MPPLHKKPGFWAAILSSKFLFVSIIVHLLFGVGATVYVVDRYFSTRKMTFKDGPPTTNPSKRALEHKVAMGKKKTMMSAPAQAKRIMTTNAAAKVALPDMPAMPSAGEVFANRMSGMGGTGFGAIAGGGGGGMGAGGGGSGVNFFGLRSRVRNVVFIVDISASMVMGNKNAASYLVLEDEVSKVIKGLDPSIRFGLVAFAGQAVAYKEQLTDARPDEKNKAITWMKKQNPAIFLTSQDETVKDKHRGTRADLGLERAFKMKPDTIFFVSDGDPTGAKPPEVLQQVEGHQKTLTRPATIHAIAFRADDGQQFMEDLSKANYGTFREVN